MTISKATRIGTWIFTIAPAAFFLIDTRGAYFHWRDAGWPDHAMFHAVTGLFYTQIICIVIIILTWIPLKAAQRWSWWTIALCGIGIHGGHIVGDQLSHHGLSGAQAAQGRGSIFFAGTCIALGLYIIGLILTYRHAHARR